MVAVTKLLTTNPGQRRVLQLGRGWGLRREIGSALVVEKEVAECDRSEPFPD